MDDKVSIIIPAYNAGDTILESVESALGQSYENIELIIVDDGSSDDTFAKVRTIEDPRVVILKQENKGVSSARNFGLANASGAYIQFLDADDVLYSNAIEQSVRVARSYGADCVVFRMNRIARTDHKNELASNVSDMNLAGKITVADNLRQMREWLFGRDEIGGYCCNKLYARESISCLFDEEVFVCEDLLFCAQNSEHWAVFAYLDEVLYCYRRSFGGGKTFGYSEKLLSLIAVDRRLDAYAEGLSSEVLKERRLWSLKNALHVRARYLLAGNRADELPREIGEAIERLYEPVVKGDGISASAKFSIACMKCFPRLTLKMKSILSSGW